MEKEHSIDLGDKITPDEIGADLWIYTKDKNPHIITQLTSVEPTKIRELGKEWYNYNLNKFIPNKLCSENIWIFGKGIKVENKEEIFLETAIEEVIQVINSNKASFKKIFLDENYISLIRCYGYYKDFHIYFRLNSKLINELSELNLTLDIDIFHLENM